MIAGNVVSSWPTTQRLAPSTGVDVAEIELGGVRLALPVSDIVAVLDPAALEVGASMGRQWIASLPSRSGALPVADARLVFDLPMDAPLGRVVVLRGRSIFGLAVDGLLGSMSPAPDDIVPLPPACGDPAYLLSDAVIRADGRLLPRVSVAHLEDWLANPTFDAPVLRLHLPPPVHSARVLIAEVGDQTVGLPIEWVLHVAADRSPAALPRAPEGVAGLLTWEQSPIPVIELLRGTRPVMHAPAVLVVVGAPGPSASGSAFGRVPVAALRVASVTGVADIEEYDGAVVLLADGRRVTMLDLASSTSTL